MENKETNSATENGIMSPPRRVLAEMSIEINDAVVGKVRVLKHPTTQMVGSVILQDLVAALCDVTPEQASKAFARTLDKNETLQEVFLIL